MHRNLINHSSRRSFTSTKYDVTWLGMIAWSTSNLLMDRVIRHLSRTNSSSKAPHLETIIKTFNIFINLYTTILQQTSNWIIQEGIPDLEFEIYHFNKLYSFTLLKQIWIFWMIDFRFTLWRSYSLFSYFVWSIVFAAGSQLSFQGKKVNRNRIFFMIHDNLKSHFPQDQFITSNENYFLQRMRKRAGWWSM